MRATVVLLALLIALGVTAPAAPAAVTAFMSASDSLIVETDESVSIDCSAGGDIEVNGAPLALSRKCADALDISVTGAEGPEEIDLADFDPVEWPFAQSISIATHGGDDVVRANPTPLVTWTIDAGPGADTFAMDLTADPALVSVLIPDDGGLTYGSIALSDFMPWTSIERLDAVLDDGSHHVDGSAFSGSMRIDGRGGADSIIGTGLADELHGGDGADTITGGEGADQVFGDAGDDELLLRDDVADAADCGPGADAAIADASDAVVACETVDLPGGDPPGEDPPGGDPPGSDPPGGGPAGGVPPDGAPLSPAPPAPPGGPTPQAETKANAATVQPRWKVGEALTIVTKLRFANVPRGATLLLRCTGRKCPFSKKRTRKVTKGAIDGLALLGKHKRLRAGQVLEARLTASGYEGKVIRYAFRTGKAPKVTTLCLPAGASKPQRRC